MKCTLRYVAASSLERCTESLLSGRPTCQRVSAATAAGSRNEDYETKVEI